MKNPKKGDLVEVVLNNHLTIGVVVESPYPAVFSTKDDVHSYSEETFAIDVLCSGKVFKKIKISLVNKIIDEL